MGLQREHPNSGAACGATYLEHGGLLASDTVDAHQRAPADRTPFKIIWGRKPHVGHLHEFVADCWVL